MSLDWQWVCYARGKMGESSGWEQNVSTVTLERSCDIAVCDTAGFCQSSFQSELRFAKMRKKVNKRRQTEFNLTVEDCVDGMRRLPSESVDLVVTSPPYNIGTRYNSYTDCRTREHYLR